MRSRSLFLCAFAGAIGVGGAWAQEPEPFHRGHAYLLLTRNPDGSWNSGPRRLTDTAYAAAALGICQPRGATEPTFNFLKGVIPSGTNEAALALMALSYADLSDEPPLEMNVTLPDGTPVVYSLPTSLGLLSVVIFENQESNGGWGADDGEPSSIPETAAVLLAITRPPVQFPAVGILGSAEFFLKPRQKTTGGWPLVEKGSELEDLQGNVWVTAALVTAVGQYLADQGLTSGVIHELVWGTTDPFSGITLGSAVQFLLGEVNADGSIGELGSVLTTAWGVRALLRTLAAGDPAVEGGVAFLEAQQLPNGSWANDVYLTALATLALFEHAQAPVPPPAELTPSPLGTAPDTLVAGLPIQATTFIHNSGGRAAGPVTVRFLVDGAPYGPTVSIKRMGAGTSTPFFAVAILGQGVHTLAVQVDPPNTVPEPNEANNTVSATVTVGPAPLPDLSVTPAELSVIPVGIVAGQPARLRARIRNTGPGTATGVVARLWKATVGPPGQPLGAPISVGTILSQDLVSVEFPLALPAGSHTLFVQVDPDSLLAEENEANNTAALGVTVFPGLLPDFSVGSSEVMFSPSAAAAGSLVTIRARVRNRAPAAPKEEELRPQVRVRFLAGDVLTGLPFGGDVILPFIDPGTSRTAEIQAAFLPGVHAVTVVVDPDLEVVEITRQNNTATAVLTVATAPLADLAVSGATATSASPLLGQPVTFSASVTNIGQAPSTPCAVRLFSYPPGPAARKLAEDAILPGLAPGQSQTVSFGWSAQAGGYAPVIVGDADLVVADADRSNNIAGFGVIVTQETIFEAPAAASHEGTDFRVIFPASFSGKGGLVIQADQPASYVVSAPGLSASGTAAPGSPAQIELPSSLMVPAEGSWGLVAFAGRVIHVTASAPVSVLFRTPTPATGTDGRWQSLFRVLPTSALGRSYTLHRFGTQGSSVTFLAEATHVVVTEPTTVEFLSEGQKPFWIPQAPALLAPGTVYRFAWTNLMTPGFRLVGDKPFAVFYGLHQPASIEQPIGSTIAGANQGVEPAHFQALPEAAFGVEYLLVAWKNPMVADHFALVATQDHTVVTIERSGGPVQTVELAAGRRLNLFPAPDEQLRVRSNRALGVWQYKDTQRGWFPGPGLPLAGYFPPAPPASSPIGHLGYRPMVSTAHFTKSVRLFLPPGLSQGQFLTILAPDPDTQVFVNGQAVPASALAPMIGGGKVAVLSVAAGERHVTATRPIGVYAEGYDLHEELYYSSGWTWAGLVGKSSFYGTTGGLRSSATGELSVTEVAAQPAVATVDQGVTLKATVANVSYAPVGSFRVRFFRGDPAQGGRPLGSDQAVAALAAGASATVSVPFSSSESGRFRIFAIADPQNLIPENIESDNVGQGIATVVGGASPLELAGSTDQGVYLVGSSGVVTAEATNVGIDPILNLKVRVRIQTAGGVEVLTLPIQSISKLDAVPPFLVGWKFMAEATWTVAGPSPFDRLLCLPWDTGALLGPLGVSGTLNPEAVRVVERTPAGWRERPSIFTGSGGVGFVEWIAHGPFAPGEVRKYQVFFDLLESGPKPPVARPEEFVLVMNEGEYVSPYQPGAIAANENQIARSQRNGLFDPFAWISEIFPPGFSANGSSGGVFGDADRDGLPDLVFAYRPSQVGAGTAGGIYLSRALGGSLFERAQPLTTGSLEGMPPFSPTPPALGDFGTDGLPHILTHSNMTYDFPHLGFFLLKSEAPGISGSPQALLPWAGNLSPRSLTALDANGDGRMDAAVVTGFSIGIYVASGTNLLEWKHSIGPPSGSLYFSALGMAAGDFDSDGKEDLVALGGWGTQLVFIHGKGDGTFLAPVVISPNPLTLSPEPLTVQAIVGGGFDFNRDSHLDLLFVIVDHPLPIEVPYPPGYMTDQRLRLFLVPGNGNGTFGSPQLVAEVMPQPPGLSWWLPKIVSPALRQVALPPAALAILAPSRTLAFPFSPSGFLPGAYLAAIEILDGAGGLLAVKEVPFTVADPQEGQVALLSGGAAGLEGRFGPFGDRPCGEMTR